MKTLLHHRQQNSLGAQFSRQGDVSLSTDVATRSNVSPWLAFYDALPNPDPVLRKTSSRIEILHEIKREPHVSACTKSRKAGVQMRLWKIDKSKASSIAAEIIENIFKDIKGGPEGEDDFRSVIREVLDGWGYGYKPLEVLWKREGNLIIPVSIIGKPPEWFCFGTDNELRLRKSDGFTSEPVEQYKFLLARNEASYSNPYGEAEFSLAFWPTTFKKGGIKFWAIFLETFGMPHAIGKVRPGAEDKEITDLLNSLSNLIRDAAGVFPNDTTVELLETKAGSGSSDLYERYARYHDGEISKCILGHGAAVDSTPGKLGGEDPSMDVRSDILDDDAGLVEDVLNKLIRDIHELNPALGKMRPRFKLYKKGDVNASRADRDSKLLGNKRITLTKKYFTTHYDFADDEIDIIE